MAATSTVIGLLLCCVFLSTVHGGLNYLWGQIGDNDFRLINETFTKSAVVGVVRHEKYVFQQSKNSKNLTISAIWVTDQKDENGARAALVAGGIGAMEVTIEFTSQPGHDIDDQVEIWGT